MSLREAAKMALEDICGAKLCEVNSMSSRAEMLRLMDSAVAALRAALAEPEQEPVAWMVEQAVKAEREACIKVCEQLEQEWEDAELWSSFKAVGFVIDAIRSRT